MGPRGHEDTFLRDTFLKTCLANINMVEVLPDVSMMTATQDSSKHALESPLVNNQ